MKRKRTLLLVIPLAFLMSACYINIPIPASIQNSFTYRYDGSYTGIDTLINIDGYYREMALYKRSPTVGGFLKDTSIYYIDTFYHYFMFYDNGIFVWNIRATYYDDNMKGLVKKDVSLFLKDFAENSETSGARYFYQYYWGSYIICRDTIKIQQMAQGQSLNAGWHLREDWYKIIDKNTIQRINAFNLPTTEISQPLNKTSSPILFFPVSAKPKSDYSWILKERWFWRHESDWRAYMERITKLKNK